MGVLHFPNSCWRTWHALFAAGSLSQLYKSSAFICIFLITSCYAATSRPLCGKAFFMVDDVAFLVTSSNSFPPPISIALDLSMWSFGWRGLIQFLLQKTKMTAMTLPFLCVTCDGGKRQKESGYKNGGPLPQFLSLLPWARPCSPQFCFSIVLTLLFIWLGR